MKVNSPVIFMECQEDYTLLYFTTYYYDIDEEPPIVRAFFSSVLKDQVREYYLKEELEPNEIILYFKYTAGEDSEVELEDLKELFNGCKILSIIP